MAANPLDIKEDIPVKLSVKTMKLVDEVTNKMDHATHAKDRLKKKNTCKRNEKSQDLKTQNY